MPAVILFIPPLFSCLFSRRSYSASPPHNQLRIETGRALSLCAAQFFLNCGLPSSGLGPCRKFAGSCKAEQIMATAARDRTDERPAPLSDTVVGRFAGDSGDGMPLPGGQYTLSTPPPGHALATFPALPA